MANRKSTADWGGFAFFLILAGLGWWWWTDQKKPAAPPVIPPVVTASVPISQTAAQGSPTSPLATPAAAQTPVRGEIPLEADAGTFVIPVIINGAISLKFTIDSGAADVTIPSDVASTLMRAGTISADDYVGSQTFVLADGSEVPSPEFRIRSLRVGNVVLHNVVASITSTNGSLLLGQSFLKRLKDWSVDNNRHVLLLEANPESDSSVGATSVVASTVAETAPTAGPSAPQDSVASMQSNSNGAVMRFYAAWSDPTDPDGQTVRSYFGDRVNFYGKPIDVSTLMSGEILRFARRWPIRSYTVRPDSLQSQCSSETGVCRVVGVVDWSVASATRSRQSRGTASFSMTLSGGRIVAENGRVLSRSMASAPGTPGAQSDQP